MVDRVEETQPQTLALAAVVAQVLLALILLGQPLALVALVLLVQFQVLR